MSTNSFSPESKIELEVLRYLYNGLHEIKYMNIPSNIKLGKKQHEKLQKYIDTLPLFYLNIIRYTKELNDEIRLSKLNGKPQTIYIITTRTDPLFVRYFSKKYTEEDTPYLFMGKKTDYTILSTQDKYAVSHPYVFMDKNGTITDGKQDLFEIFDKNIEIDIIPPSPSPSPSPQPQKPTQISKPKSKSKSKSKPKSKSKSTKPIIPLRHDIGTSPMEIAIAHAEPKPVYPDIVQAVPTPVYPDIVQAVPTPVYPDIVHAIPIIPSIKPIQLKRISKKNKKNKKRQQINKNITKKMRNIEQPLAQ